MRQSHKKIVDSACAILLHNYYRNVLIKQFTCGPLDAERYPIAYLLIFCDEMQDWNRAGYGILEKYRTQIAAANIFIDNNSFKITYFAERGIIRQQFVEDKLRLIDSILNIRGIFLNGLNIECVTLEEIFNRAQSDRTIPRPLLENMELLAREIHNDYIENQKRNNGPIRVSKELNQLEASVRYSNLRQAMNMEQKLRKLGYALVSKDFGAEAVEVLPDDVKEQYAVLEHSDWSEGKLRFGWQYAPIRNDAEHLHDCLLPWKDLPELQKDKDRYAAANVIKLAQIAGMKVIRI